MNTEKIKTILIEEYGYSQEDFTFDFSNLCEDIFEICMNEPSLNNPEPINQNKILLWKQKKSNMQTEKTYKWKDLKEFVNSLNEEKLEQDVAALVEATHCALVVSNGFITDDDILVNKLYADDIATESELKELYGENYKREDYIVATPIGTPFIYIP